jgi:hypothetical protein
MEPYQLQYSDTYSVLVINAAGQLRKVYTPFRAQCTATVAGIPANSWVHVTAVWPHARERLLYQIGDRLYPYHLFHIHIGF